MAFPYPSKLESGMAVNYADAPTMWRFATTGYLPMGSGMHTVRESSWVLCHATLFSRFKHSPEPNTIQVVPRVAG